MQRYIKLKIESDSNSDPDSSLNLKSNSKLDDIIDVTVITNLTSDERLRKCVELSNQAQQQFKSTDCSEIKNHQESSECNIDSTTVYSCPITSCTNEFSSKLHIFNHLCSNKHYNTRHLACSYSGCVSRFNSRSSLLRHERSHNKQKNSLKRPLENIEVDEDIQDNLVTSPSPSQPPSQSPSQSPSKKRRLTNNINIYKTITIVGNFPTTLDVKLTGKFQIIANDGIYIGDIYRGEKHGWGKYIAKYGPIYIGRFNNGLRHGIGHCIYPRGSLYYGMWYNDVRHNKGIYMCQNGIHYKGEWCNGVPNGKGKLFYPDGKIAVGEWFNGEIISSLE